MTFFENQGDGCSQDETAQLSTCDYSEKMINFASEIWLKDVGCMKSEG
jgi:hypothetical protein